MIVITLSDDALSFRVHRVDSRTKASVDVTEEYQLHHLCCRSGDRLLGGVFLGKDVTEEMKDNVPPGVVEVQPSCPSSSESTSPG